MSQTATLSPVVRCSKRRRESEAPPSPSTQELQASAVSLPRELVRQLRGLSRAAVEVKQHDGFTLTTFGLGDESQVALAMYNCWVESLPDDADPYATPIMAGRTTQAEVVEVWGVLRHYATLTAADFRAGAVGVPQGAAAPAARGPVHFHHSQMALSAVTSRLHDPGNACPAIDALPAGTHVCDVQWTWGRGHIVIIPIVKQ